MICDFVKTDRGSVISEGKEYFPASKIAKMLNVTRAAVYKWVAKDKWPEIRIPGKGARNGVRYYLVPRKFLMDKNAIDSKIPTNQGETSALQKPDIPESLDDFVFVPKYDVNASAGYGSIVHSEQIVDHLAFKKVWIKSTLGCSEKDLALITVKGDSMEPTLSSGDLILVDLQRNQITDNAVYVLQYDGSLLVKRIQRLMNGSVIIKSDNPEYRAEELSADQVGLLRVLGMVVWYGRKM